MSGERSETNTHIAKLEAELKAKERHIGQLANRVGDLTKRLHAAQADIEEARHRNRQQASMIRALEAERARGS